MTTSSNDVLRINSQDVVWREIGDELVVMHMGTATYLTINGSGKVLWVRLAEGATSEQLAETLSERYGVDADRSRADVQSFLASLAACALLALPA